MARGIAPPSNIASILKFVSVKLHAHVALKVVSNAVKKSPKDCSPVDVNIAHTVVRSIEQHVKKPSRKSPGVGVFYVALNLSYRSGNSNLPLMAAVGVRDCIDTGRWLAH